MCEIDQVGDYLFIGGESTLTLPNILDKFRIKKIVSVMKRQNMDQSSLVNLKDSIEFLHIDVHDMPDEDLLTYFDATYHFIHQAVQEKICVYVHCMCGVSRSATIVTAYLMKSENLSAGDAYSLLKSKRGCVRPNTGFFKQLKLYETMKCTVNEQNSHYIAFKMNLLSKKGHKFDSTEMLKLVSDEPNPHSGDVFKCKKCRRLIFAESSIINHTVGSNLNAYDNEKSLSQNENLCNKDPYRILPVKWMEEILKQASGKLYCPKCGSLVGKFDWKGQGCMCSAWIIPGIHIHAKSVDLCRKQ